MSLINKFYEDILSGSTTSSDVNLKDRDLIVINYLNNCKKVFEIGVGSGYTLSKVNAIYKGGVDISSKSIQLAKKLLLKDLDEKQLELHQNNIDAEDLPISSDKYDGVMIVETLEHLFDPIHALSESNRILKKNGLLAITVPNIGYFETRFLMLSKGELNEFSGSGKILTEHIRFYGKKSLIEIVELAGFKVVNVKGCMKKIVESNQKVKGIDKAESSKKKSKNKIKKINLRLFLPNFSNFFKLLNKFFKLYKIYPSLFAVGLVVEAVKVGNPKYNSNEAISEDTEIDEYKHQINQTKP